MGNVVIIINDQEIKDFQPSELGLSTSWESKLIKQLNAFKVKTTKTISLVVTKQLSKALNAPDIIDSVSLLNPEEKPTIKIFVDGELFLDGYMRITNGLIFKIGSKINFNVQPIERDWWTALQNLNMQDVDLSVMDHTFGISEIAFGLDSTTAADEYAYYPVNVGWVGLRRILSIQDAGGGTSRIFYLGNRIATSETVTILGCPDSYYNVEATLTDVVFGSIWAGLQIYVATTPDITAKENSYSQLGFFTNDFPTNREWQTHDFVPSPNMRYLIEAVFGTIGWSIVGENYLSILENKWQYDCNKENLGKALNKRLEFRTGIQEGHYTLTGVTGTIRVPFQKFDDLGLNSNQYYNDSNSDTLAEVVAKSHTSEWVAPENCYFYLDTRTYFLGNATHIDITVYDASGTVYLVVATETLSSGTSEHDIRISGLAYIPATYKVNVSIHFTGGTFTPVIFDDSYFHGTPVHAYMENMPVHMNELLPNVSAYTWLKDLTLLHQLNFYTNEATKEVFVHMDNDKMNTNIVDWVEKLNRDTIVDISPVSLAYPSSYRFDWLSDGNDYEMTFLESISGRFAGGSITNTNPFAEGEESISLEVFAATKRSPIRYENTFEMGIPIMRGENGERLDYKSRIFELERDFTLNIYYEDADEIQYLEIDGIPVEEFPRAYFPEDLHFDALILSHWQRVVEAINYGHILRGSFRLTSQDANKFNTLTTSLNQFRSWHAIQVNGVEVRCELLKVIDFQPTTNDDTICELLWIIKRN